jgi:peptide alpha-N-acetyltransferase
MDPTPPIRLVSFSTPSELQWITETLRQTLAEPYSVFTYYYFVKNWPELTVMAYLGEDIIGCIIGNIDASNPRKAYIAMLVVLPAYRRLRIGMHLFNEFVRRVQGKVDKIVLETECINLPALSFYTRLGFFKTRKMSNYYLSGNDAYRLKLYLPKHPLQEQKEEAVQGPARSEAARQTEDKGAVEK